MKLLNQRRLCPAVTAAGNTHWLTLELFGFTYQYFYTLLLHVLVCLNIENVQLSLSISNSGSYVTTDYLPSDNNFYTETTTEESERLIQLLLFIFANELGRVIEFLLMTLHASRTITFRQYIASNFPKSIQWGQLYPWTRQHWNQPNERRWQQLQKRGHSRGRGQRLNNQQHVNGEPQVLHIHNICALVPSCNKTVAALLMTSKCTGDSFVCLQLLNEVLLCCHSANYWPYGDKTGCVNDNFAVKVEPDVNSCSYKKAMNFAMKDEPGFDSSHEKPINLRLVRGCTVVLTKLDAQTIHFFTCKNGICKCALPSAFTKWKAVKSNCFEFMA